MAAAALVVVVVAVAYGSAAPQLAVAEFSPSAQRTVEPPPTSTGEAATPSAGGGRGRITTTLPPTTSGSSAATAEAAAPTTRVGRTRSCVGTPPRQTEDPMSPPCVTTIFEGDNGGSTARGITATEIRVGVLDTTSAPAPTSVFGQVALAMVEYFNARYELYGRRLVPVLTGGTASSALNARATAAHVASQDVFGALTAALDWSQPQSALVQALARDEVVTVVGNMSSWWTDRTMFDPLHPYVWSVYPSAEDLQVNVGDFACSGLAGRKAVHAGTPALKDQTRRFGIFAIGQEVPPSAGVLGDALATCSGEAPARASWLTSGGTAALDSALNQFKSAGVTTVFCACESYIGRSSMFTAAHRAGFYPEWIMPPSPSRGGDDNGDEGGIQLYRRQATLAPPMRMSAGPRLLPLQARPWFQALETTSPTLAADSGNAYSVWTYATFLYEQLLVLVTGIQGAGPTLTPDTFAAALMSTTFANTAAGAAPFWQPSAGFGVGDHSLYDDYSIAWWSDTAPALGYPASSSSPQGSWCYVGQGARFRPGTYPADANAALFDPNLPCR